MEIDDKIRDEKPQFDIYKEATKISALSSKKIDKYFAGKEILHFDQRRVIEQAKFNCSPSVNALENKKKNN